jgi:hypothetical protein
MMFCAIVPLFVKTAAYLYEGTREERRVLSEEVRLII